jgi:hypothetical protein
MQCPHCGTTTPLDPSTQAGTCPRCRTELFSAEKTRGPGMNLVLPIGLAVGGVLLTGAVIGLVALSDKNSLRRYNITPARADPEAMVLAAEHAAKAWRPDATFHAIRIQALRTDGTTDLTRPNTNVVVEFASASSSASTDRVRSYVFTNNGMTEQSVSGATNTASALLPPCTPRRLGAALAQSGVGNNETVQAQYDPAAVSTEAAGWFVVSTTPTFRRWFDAGDCSAR